MAEGEVIKNLRSCLISCKDGVKLTSLKNDYFTVVGEQLPYKQFGYSSVEAFVRSIPEVLVTKKNGELYVEAVPSKTTAHLTKLIARQKPRKTKPKKVNKFNNCLPKRTNYNSTQRIRARSNYADSSSSFIKPPPKTHTDLHRPPPLMQTVVHQPLPNYNKPSFSPGAPPVASISTKRLNDKMTNLDIAANQSDNYNQDENLKPKVSIKPATVSVIPVQSRKTVEQKPSKLSERLKVISPGPSPPPPPLPSLLTLSIDNYNNNTCSIVIPPASNVLKTTPKSGHLDPRQELESRASELKLTAPVYWISSNKEKHSAKLTVYAGVRVGPRTFTTYPEAAASEEEAKKSAARLALAGLSKESTSLRVTTVDAKLVKERILQIVSQHTAGVFTHRLPVYYNEQYREALPENWQTIVKESPEINQEKGAGDWTILCIQCSSTSKPTDSSPTSSRDVSDHSVSPPSDEKIHLKPIGPVVPGQLTVPRDTIWEVYTACVISTTEVWVRFGDDNEKFVNMMSNMRKHYGKVKEGASGCVVVGDFYALFDDNSWHRVQCVDFDSETETAVIRFIDEGYEEVYKSNLLYPLDKEFCALPIQAMRVSLHELEDFCDCAQVVAEVESHLLVEQMFVVRVHSMDFDNSYATVTFYDTSDDTVDININELIFDKLLGDIDAASKMHPGKLSELYVTHLYEDGKTFAQQNTLAKTLLDEAILQISKSDAFVKANSFTKTYLVKWCSQWRRTRVIDIPSNEEVTVLFIDYGQVITTSRQCLLNRSSKALERIPPQAMQIFLHNVDAQSHGGLFVTRFRELVSDVDLLLAKVVKVSATGVPIVEIFKRVGPSNMLASINTSLTLGNELSKANEDSNNNIRFKKRLERKISRILEPVGNLKPPVISDIRKYFDVHVILVAHPGHFIVQPLNDASHLEAMIINLQKNCNSYNGPPMESVGKGKLYAGKYKDQWRRVYVTNIISDSEVSVYFCDFGDVTILSRDSLQPLKAEFMKLPYQAVKAKLVGIEPINSDWSVEDSLRFKDLVLDKNFVSVVVESSSDHYSPANGVVLGLRLIDVSTTEDIYIDGLLVEEKRAKYTEGYPFAYPNPHT